MTTEPKTILTATVKEHGEGRRVRISSTAIDGVEAITIAAEIAETIITEVAERFPDEPEMKTAAVGLFRHHMETLLDNTDKDN